MIVKNCNNPTLKPGDYVRCANNTGDKYGCDSFIPYNHRYLICLCPECSDEEVEQMVRDNEPWEDENWEEFLKENE